mmetsp:Transcript_10394/g.10406  ORF Transcript_10394/g.10406 Transcript_10394/m.10406 type:complete len:94 (+) Transcript_10394:909-1190(+)
MTPCCIQSACFKCIQKALVEKQNYCCMFCKTADLMIEDIIPNKQLQIVVEWYLRYITLNNKLEEKEIKHSKQQEQKELLFMIKKITQIFQGSI